METTGVLLRGVRVRGRRHVAGLGGIVPGIRGGAAGVVGGMIGVSSRRFCRGKSLVCRRCLELGCPVMSRGVIGVAKRRPPGPGDMSRGGT